VLGGLLAALAAAGGFALAGVPNVEIITLLIFLSGYLYGLGLGAIVGAVGEAIFSGANPLGPAPPPIFVGQVAGMCLAGMAGGVFGRLPAPSHRAARVALFATAGIVVTLLFHVLTDAAYALIARLTWTYILAGIAFSVLHLVTNAALFGLAGPAIVDAARSSLGGPRRARI
jgi:hypothetical protein